MAKIVVFAESLPTRLIAEAAGGGELRTVGGRRELVTAIVEERAIHSVLIQKDAIDEAYRGFLRSLADNFPLLPVAVITAPSQSEAVEGHRFISGEQDEASLRQEIGRFTREKVEANRRERHRFDWPLKGFLSLDGKRRQEYRLRSMSSGGAFLECSSTFPPSGTRASLWIEFQNFRMHTVCEILDARLASSNLPLGFGVRFIDLPDGAAEKIDRIVDDALVHVLMDPDFEPETPSLDGDQTMNGRFDFF